MKTHPFLILLGACVVASFGIRSFGDDNAPAAAPTAPAAELVSLQFQPPSVQLDSARDPQRVVLVATYADGITHDVTARAPMKPSAEGIVKIGEDLRLYPVADGEVTLDAAFEGKTASIKATVKNATLTPAQSFRLDVEPVIMRAGCNSGACHGASRGKNGFGLTLFGFDPAQDYMNLTRQTRARRLSTAAPEASLMLQKATTGVAHEGGLRFKPDSPLYKTVDQWIKEGAKPDPPEVAKVTSVEILPKQMVLYGAAGEKAGDTHRVVVRAFYSDGTDRDVTSLAILASLNDNSATLSEDGVITAKSRGEASIIARFSTYAVVAQVIVVPPDEAFAWTETADANPIDELVSKKQKQMRMLPSAVCSDDIFVRRVYMDIVGLLPTKEETEKFLADPAPDKRAKLIDVLLQKPEFPELWAMKWAEMLRIESQSQKISRKAMFRYTQWLRDQIVSGVPMDKMASALLTAKGGNFTNPASNFYLVESDPLLMAENVAQVFTGIRVQCAQCHNHPFERWTQDDYYSFAAFFSQVGRKGAEDPREVILFNAGGGDVRHVRTAQVMAPKFLGSDKPADLKGRDRREVLAEWLTSPENPWFSKAFANRVWTHFMGRGVVDPPDDVRVSNPPSNPELFEMLGNNFAKSGYDLRQLVREICNSKAYQRSTQANPTNAADLSNFTRRLPKRLSAEQLLDAVCQVTETPEKFGGLPLGARAIQVADGNTGNYFLSIFGRPARSSACTCDRRDEPTLSQALHLINGNTVAARIKSDGSRLDKLVKAGKSNDEIVNDLYLAAFARKPLPEELTQAQNYMAGLAEGPDRKKGLEDVYWAVLNSKEFVFAH